MSASLDKTIKMWNLKAVICEHTFLGHDEGISRGIKLFDENYFLSGTQDKTIKMWDYKKKQLHKEFTSDEKISAILPIDAK